MAERRVPSSATAGDARGSTVQGPLALGSGGARCVAARRSESAGQRGEAARRRGGNATAAQMLHAVEQCGARGRRRSRIWWRRLRRRVGCGGGPGARLKGKAGPRRAGLRGGRGAGITAENLGWLLLRSASVKGGFALWGRDVKEGARQQASRAAGAGSGLGPRAAGLGRVSRGAGGGRGRTLLAGRGCQRPSG